MVTDKYRIDDINTLRGDTGLNKYPVSLSSPTLHITMSNHTTTTTGKQLSFSSLELSLQTLLRLFPFSFPSCGVEWKVCLEMLYWTSDMLLKSLPVKHSHCWGRFHSITRHSQALHYNHNPTILLRRAIVSVHHMIASVSYKCSIFVVHKYELCSIQLQLGYFRTFLQPEQTFTLD